MVTKAKPVKAKPKIKKKPTIVAVGIDVSMSSIAGAAIMHDSILQTMRGPVWHVQRWKQSDDYFKRMVFAAKAHDFVFDLVCKMHGAIFDLDEIWIAVEEPWPWGVVKRAQSGWLKQQAQIQGAFLASLARYGYPNLFEVNIPDWQSRIASDLDMKWSKKDGFTKWTIKEWAQEVYPEIPDWPDLIRKTNVGLVAKPKSSNAKPVQPDDRFDATGLMDWAFEEAQKSLKVKAR